MLTCAALSCCFNMSCAASCAVPCAIPLQSNSSTSLHLDNIGQFSNLRSLRLVNIGCVSHILPQLSQLRGLQSLELVGANHGPYVDSAPSTLLPIPTAACWEPLVTALSGQLTKLVLVQCVTERASVPLMLRHLSALQELELSYIKHSTSQEDPWASRGRMDPMLQPWLAPKNVDMGNLPFVPGCLPHLKSLTLRGVHVEDASELSYLSGSHASTAAAGVDSSSGSSSCLAASMQQYLAPSRSRTGLTRFSAKRWTFDGAAGVQSLMAAIGCLTGLQELSVGQTCLSEAPAAAFRAIGGLSWLKVLDLHWVSEEYPKHCSCYGRQAGCTIDTSACNRLCVIVPLCHVSTAARGQLSFRRFA